MLFHDKLFRREMEPRCAYCRQGEAISEREVICLRRGLVMAEDSCRRFRYDPLKRVPPRPASLEIGRLRKEDFSI